MLKKKYSPIFFVCAICAAGLIILSNLAGKEPGKVPIKFMEKYRIKCESGAGRHDVIFLDTTRLAYSDTLYDHDEIVFWNFVNKTKNKRFTDNACFYSWYDISPDERFVATGGGGECYLKVWNLANENVVFSKRAAIREIEGIEHAIGSVKALRFTKDSQQLIVGSTEGMLTTIDLVSFTEIHNFFLGEEIRRLVLSPDNGYVATCHWNNISIVDRNTGKKVNSIEAANDIIRAVCFSPNGDGLLFSQDDSIVKFDLKSGTKKTLTDNLEGWVVSFDYSHDGNFIFVAVNITAKTRQLKNEKWESYLAVISAQTGELISRIDYKGSDPFGGFSSISKSPNGEMLATSGGEEIILWDILTEPSQQQGAGADK